ncbi:Uncharacterised protein [Citrobacter werkmanii]|uniref:Ead/Ea22-like family protein n=1 Tax=Citrobacter werkmanii TaxID=67827 RepID=A0A9N8CSX5_9ENTR|nr:Uncharacterised protein [Citrobacter werkmanii]CAB5546643.1 Uncharacterised protein [Citrobacter werkmanii]CAB5573381.1 Uncharacterised protein [Citrobacter werkmanii]CAB5573845.1 Uncharacterised protein [Citrobacter werkmanii]CAB5576170.1 Uncharacterised protein [Citrobacter werkmanii]
MQEGKTGNYVKYEDYVALEKKLTDMAVQLANAERKCRELAVAAENNLIDSECHVAELEEALRDKQALLEAAEKRIAEHRKVLNSLAAVARRYLPDYDEHPEIQAADELLESAAGIGVKGE